jgi:hypothetical protein
MIPTSIDGTDITGATIDGTDVTEITVDGQTVFVSAFSRFDDFDTNTLSDYTIFESTSTVTTGFTITSGELRQDDDNQQYFFEFNVSSEGLNDFFVETVVADYSDNDSLGVGFVVDNSTIVIGDMTKQRSIISLGSASFPRAEYAARQFFSDQKSFSDFSTPLTQRLEYDSSTSTAKYFHEGIQELSMSFSHSGTITGCGISSNVNSPGPHWESLEIGEL